VVSSFVDSPKIEPALFLRTGRSRCQRGMRAVRFAPDVKRPVCQRCAHARGAADRPDWMAGNAIHAGRGSKLRRHWTLLLSVVLSTSRVDPLTTL